MIKMNSTELKTRFVFLVNKYEDEIKLFEDHLYKLTQTKQEIEIISKKLNLKLNEIIKQS